MNHNWFLFYVKPRTEKKFASFASAYAQNFRSWHFVYLPLRRQVRIVQRRKVVSFLPLFPGYVFAWLTNEERRRLLNTGLVVHTLKPDSERNLVHQLRQIRHALRVQPDATPVDSFTAGEKVKIITGPFEGIEGVVKRTRNITKVVLNINFITTAMEVTIEPGDIVRV